MERFTRISSQRDEKSVWDPETISRSTNIWFPNCSESQKRQILIIVCLRLRYIATPTPPLLLVPGTISSLPPAWRLRLPAPAGITSSCDSARLRHDCTRFCNVLREHNSALSSLSVKQRFDRKMRRNFTIISVVDVSKKTVWSDYLKPLTFNL